MQSKIKDIKVGDYVKSWDFDSHSVVKAEVINVWKNKNDTECFRVNDKLIVTGSHQVYTKDGYKFTKDIQIGDKLLGSDGKYTKVKSFRLNSFDVPYVHNLTVKVNNYFANGILVHNGGGGSTKVGNWQGSDKVVDPAMSGLRDAVDTYLEMNMMLEEQHAVQTGEVTSKLALEQKKLALSMGQENRKFQKKVGQTNLATVALEERDDIEALQKVTGEEVQQKGESERSELRREHDKEGLAMKTSLRSSITSAYGTAASSDSFWTKTRRGNVFTSRGGMNVDNMIKKREDDHKGYRHYCVSPDTKIEMWTE